MSNKKRSGVSKWFGVRHCRAILQAIDDVNWYRYAQSIGIRIYASDVERDREKVKQIWDGKD